MNLRFLHAVQVVAAISALAWCVTACAATAQPTAPAGPEATPGPTPTVTGTPSATPVPSIAETVRDFRFDQPALTVATGTTITVSNAGPTIHNLTIRDASGTVVGGTSDLRPGASTALAIPLPPGTYIMFCSLPGHESLGLKGTLTVSP